MLSAAGLALLHLSARPPARLSARRGGGGGRLIERWSWAMGQPVHLALYADSDDRAYEAAARALGELRRVESRLTLFDDASDLVELNRRAGGRAMRVDADLAAVLAAAAEARLATGGAFNVAVEPLMRTWGFHRPRATAPSPAEIEEAREAVGAAVVVLDGDRAALPARHTQLDFGGIGVGYGLDRMAAVLRRSGVRSAFIDISGDCLAIGTPPGQSGWEVAIADPRHPGRVVETVRLRDRALATSANTVSVVRYGKEVRGHVMDPASGYPAERKVQATAVARTGLLADTGSTAMLVMGRPAPGVERAIFV
ncbi:MAG TPA: FAD:protein FMN transferase [Gemmatimonadales bacterium]|nr:FAD:protein FMN transferase [Gemmatimonadales bacterium]